MRICVFKAEWAGSPGKILKFPRDVGILSQNGSGDGSSKADKVVSKKSLVRTWWRSVVVT